MTGELPQVFWEIHSNLPREGPGDNESTKKAFQMLQDLPKNPHIIDIACGPGMQTIQLAKLSEGKIVALDFYQPFLEQLKANAKKEGLDDKIDTINGDMLNLNFENESFDLVWSEGAIYIIGFEKGLREWKHLLSPKGYVVVSEMSWFQPDLPEEIVEFMDMLYPAIKTVEDNLEVAKRIGYDIVNSFVLPQKSWWDNYYNWIEAKLPALKTKYKDNKEVMEHINCEETEIEMFRKYSDYYGYVFYILQKK
ncbi:MAG: class I SAM-dependent methyltransferase [Candidatus Bathyarchaeum tardum]|nr:MAG: class I SAM-dependent methyltransferase [Candidatus Bathyarchaeum tardum]